MKKQNILLLIAILALSGILYCAPLRFVPQKFVQPNGDTLKCFASGDEFYHWLHDKDGYTITFNPETKYWVYADKKGDDLIPTDLVPGKSDPVKAKLKKWLLPNWNSIKNNYIKRAKPKK
jgi:hypothetical protein